jgi:hypothetical protein
MSDAGFSNQWIMHQYIGKFGQFSHRAATAERTVMRGCDPRAVITAVLQTFQGINQNWRGLMAA